MYLNRIRHSRDGTKSKIIKAESEASQDCTFQPILTDNTQALAERYRQKIAENYEGGKITVLDILTAQTNKEQWIEETKKELQDKEQEECTFQPLTNETMKLSQNQSIESTGDKCFDLYHLSRAKGAKNDKTKEDYEFEKNVEECTFKPNINKSNKRPETEPHYVNQRSIQETLDRMKRGRDEREFKKKMTQRGFDNPIPNKKPAKKPVNNRPMNYIRPQLRNNPKSAVNSRVTSKKEENKTSYAGSKKVRRTAADRNRLAQPTKSSQRKVTTKVTEKKEIRTTEQVMYEAKHEPQIEPESMYRRIEEVEEQVHQNIPDSPQEYPDQEPIERYIDDEPIDYENDRELDQDGEPEAEGEDAQYPEGADDQEDTMSDNAEGEGNPLLFVDVNLGPGRAERIVVYEGDTAEELAAEFTKKHGLDDTLMDKLVKLLESQIAGLLGPITEIHEGTSNEAEN